MTATINAYNLSCLHEYEHKINSESQELFSLSPLDVSKCPAENSSVERTVIDYLFYRRFFFSSR